MVILPLFLAAPAALMSLHSFDTHCGAEKSRFSAEQIAPVEELQQSHGASGFLRQRDLIALAGANSRDNQDFLGSIDRLEMDFWWSTQGSALITANVRAALPAS